MRTRVWSGSAAMPALMRAAFISSAPKFGLATSPAAYSVQVWPEALSALAESMAPLRARREDTTAIVVARPAQRLRTVAPVEVEAVGDIRRARRRRRSGGWGAWPRGSRRRGGRRS